MCAWLSNWACLVSAQLAKLKSSDKTLLYLHRVVFGRPGEAAKRKSDLRLFHGFPGAVSVATLEKKLAGQTIPMLRDVCILLNLERGGEKKDMVARLAGFLLQPKDLGKSKPAPIRKAAGKKADAKKAAGKKAVGKKAAGKKLSTETVDSEDDYADEIAELKAGTSAA